MSNHSDSMPRGKTTRRAFSRQLALLAAAPLLARGGETHADDEPAPDPLAASAAALTEAARARFGKSLAEEHVKDVLDRIHRSLVAGQSLKQFKLQNSDEPAFVFRAD
jgi:hypothetical protein